MKILIIATQLPPYIGSGNIRALNYINHLSRMDHQIEVIGVDYPKDAIAYDYNLENQFDKNVKLNRIKPGFPYRFFYRKKDDNNDTTNKNNVSLNQTFKGKLNTFIKDNFIVPDAFMFWIYPAYKQAKKRMIDGQYDVVFSLHETPSSHIVGYLLKRKYKSIRWIGYWSDPWNGDSLRGKRSIYKRWIEERLEKIIVGKVDKLLFTTEKTKRLYKEKYSLNEKEVDIVFRGYDKDLFNNLKIVDKGELSGFKSDKINILHSGTIYHELRDVKPLCKALDILKNEDLSLYNKLNIVFIGQFDNYEDQRKLLKHGIVTILPLMSFEDAIKYTVSADMLLLYGNKNSTQIPGKVYEYLGSEAVILTIYGDNYDELKQMMEKANKGPVIKNHEVDIYKTIKKFISNIENNNVNKAWKMSNKQYEWENVALDLEIKLLS